MDTEELSLHTPGASAVPDTKELTALRVSLRSFRQQQKKKNRKKLIISKIAFPLVKYVFI